MTPDEKRAWHTAENTLVAMFATANDDPDATWQTLEENLSEIELMYLLQCTKTFIEKTGYVAYRGIQEKFGHSEKALGIIRQANVNADSQLESSLTLGAGVQ